MTQVRIDQPTAPGGTAGRMGWAGLTMVISKGATVAAMLVLSRLLVPEDFGLFAVGILVINYLDRVKDVGIGSALVYRREQWSDLAGTGLTLSIAASALAGTAAFLLAPAVAAFFHAPEARELLRALALVIVISGFSIVPDSRLRRELQFKRRLIPEAATAVVKGGVSIVLALAGFGVWSLVWGQLAGTVVQTVLYWLLAGWRPRPAWNRSDAAKLLRYGVPSMFVAILAVVHENLDYLLIGHRLPAVDLGYYFMAFRIPELLVIGICVVAGQVLFPTLSRLQDDLRRLGGAYVGAVRSIAVFTTPIALLLALLAPEVIAVLYGDQWDAAVPVLRLLGVFSAVYALSFHAGEVYKATGRPGILNSIAVGKLLFLAPAMWFAAGHSIVAVAGVILAGNVVLTGVKLAIVIRIAHLSWARMLRAFVPAVSGAALMTVVVTTASLILPVTAPLGRLLLLGAVGVGAFGLGVWLAAPDLLRSARGMLSRRRATSTPERG